MKLTTTDLDYINHRMGTYDIKYQEIYDELKDHLILATETARANGDKRNISDLFEDVVETQFPGYWAFEDISKEYEKAYRKKIRHTFWTNVKSYINAGSVLAIIVLMILSFYLPHTRIVAIVFYLCLCVLALVPSIYAWFKMRKMNLVDGKQSMVKNHVNRRGSFLVLIIQLVLNLLNLIADTWHIPALKPANYSPVILMTLLCAFILYSLSFMRLCRQEVKLSGLSTNN